jgi:arylsulfatase A-like enzyme
MASIMTSLLPAEHGAVRRLDRLPPRHDTLAELLQQEGWATGAVVTNAILYARREGFDQGFDHFTGLHGRKRRRGRQVRASVAVDAALSWIDSRRGLPTFVWVHTMDPHFPYKPPAPFDRKFSPDDVPDLPGPGGDETADARRKRRHAISQYDGEIAFGDQELGRFLRELETRGLYDRALIVFLSDHGDEFLEHGGLGHGTTVFDELVRIPLLVKFPGGQHGGRRVGQQVLGMDVMPTILQAAGVELDGSLGGRTLQSVLTGDEPPVPALVETLHWNATALSVRTETDKYIRRFSPEDDELYFDLTRDPHEQVNRAQEDTERVRALRAQIGTIMRPTPYRYVLRASGSGRFSLGLRTPGVFEQVEVSGLGSEEAHAVEGDGQALTLDLRPRPGAPREVSFLVRPAGAPVRLEGTRDGRSLRPEDVTAAGDRHPEDFPFLLPEPERENPPERARELFRPPEGEREGLGIWLVESSPDAALEVDEDSLEALRALGYVDP